jgi:hypothetical protein
VQDLANTFALLARLATAAPACAAALSRLRVAHRGVVDEMSAADVAASALRLLPGVPGVPPVLVADALRLMGALAASAGWPALLEQLAQLPLTAAPCSAAGRLVPLEQLGTLVLGQLGGWHWPVLFARLREASPAGHAVRRLAPGVGYGPHQLRPRAALNPPVSPARVVQVRRAARCPRCPSTSSRWRGAPAPTRSPWRCWI